MASECILTGPDEIVHARLKHIAPYSYWRNVFLFAAGKCFSTPQVGHHRVTIMQICNELNDPEETPAFSRILAGSILALDILEDGTVNSSPMFTRLFAELALKLIDNDFYRHSPRAQSLTQRLAEIYEPRMRDTYEKEISRLLLISRENNQPVWNLLINLESRGIDWALVILQRMWPKGSPIEKAILGNFVPNNSISPWLIDKLSECVPQMEPEDICFGVTNFSVGERENLAWLETIFRIPYLLTHEDSVPLSWHGLPDGAINISFDFVFNSENTWGAEDISNLANIPNPSAGWIPYVSSSRFIKNPTKEQLAAEIEPLQLYLLHLGTTNQNEIPSMPWPLEISLHFLKAGANVQDLKLAITQGRWADTEEWKMLETSFDNVFLSLDEEVGPAPIGEDMASWLRWLLLSRDSGSYINPHNENPELVAVAMLEKLAHYSNSGKVPRRIVKSAIIGALSELKRQKIMLPPIPSEHFRLLWDENIQFAAYINILNSFSWPTALSEDWLNTLDWIGRQANSSGFFGPIYANDSLYTILSEQYASNPELVGLVRILASGALRISSISIPHALLNPSRFADPIISMAAISIMLAGDCINQPTQLAEEIAKHLTADSEIRGWSILGNFNFRQRMGRPSPKGSLELIMSLGDLLSGTKASYHYNYTLALWSILLEEKSHLSDEKVAALLNLPWIKRNAA